GSGAVVKWSKTQSDSNPSFSAARASAFERAQASSAGRPLYSPVQPWGMTTPIFIAGTSFVTAATGLLVWPDDGHFGTPRAHYRRRRRPHACPSAAATRCPLRLAGPGWLRVREPHHAGRPPDGRDRLDPARPLRRRGLCPLPKRGNSGRARGRAMADRRSGRPRRRVGDPAAGAPWPRAWPDPHL